MALPMMILMGFNLHVPLVLQSLSLLPDWANVNKDVAITDFVYRLWLQRTIYLGGIVSKPSGCPRKPTRLFAYDFYNNLYRLTVVGLA